MKFLKWLGSVVLGGIVWWLVSIGGGLAISALAASFSGLDQPWISLFAVGVFLLGCGLTMGAARISLALLPLKVRRTLQGGRRMSGSPVLLPFRTSPQQLSDLI